MNSKKYTSPLLLVGGGADEIDVQYVANFTAPDPFLFLGHKGERIVVVSSLELGRAQRVSPPLTPVSPDDLDLPKGKRRDLGRQAVALLRQRGLSAVGVSSACPVGLVRYLESAGIKVTVRQEPVMPGRLCKEASEIKALRKIQRTTAKAMQTAVDLIRSSEIGADGKLFVEGEVLTSERVRAHVEMLLIRENAQGDELIVAGGDQAVDPHERGTGPLYAHAPIVLDIFPRDRASGYWGDMTRTVLRGKPSPEQRKLYRTVLDAQKQALSLVAPGVSGKEIHQRVCDVFEAAGYETGLEDGVPQGFIHSTGHGLGLQIHEAPSVSPAGGPLEPGQVITIEPGLYYRGIGGVRIEDSVVVTEKGSSILATSPKVFVL
ncbi:MAG: aminopeptidase P family protein [Verrucomicrobia bacterium]|nr:aminopeptidase P family protein [Verrucomicrobiota bacterium]MCH8513794.1 Xaa-Pro peptidase family protein [Kiritimatiellia bacterium]